MRSALLLASLIVHTQTIAAENRCNDFPEGSTAGEACIRMASVTKTEQQIDQLLRKMRQGYAAGSKHEDAKLLGNTQRTWLAYRAAACEFEQHQFGGALQISYWRCMDRFTSERLKDVKALQ